MTDKKSMLWWLFVDFEFCGPVSGKMGVAALWAHKGMDPQNQTRKSTHSIFLLSRNHIFQFPYLKPSLSPLEYLRSNGS